MFWKKETAAPESASPLPPPRRAEDPETAALETVAALLRSLGRHAFDLDELPRAEIEERFEKWALRLLVGEPRGEDDGAPTSRRGIQRDWGGVKRFVETHRADEKLFVETGFENLRAAVKIFLHTTTSTLREEREAALLMAGELDQLDRALAVNDHEAIRRAAESTARAARDQLDRRRHREKEQIEALQTNILELQSELAEARRAASIDALTQVWNRSALDAHLASVSDQSFLSGRSACIVMVDIDHFKQVNDSYGHPAGDEVIRQIADAIVRVFLRREDFVARYGGEEFCVVAQHTTFDTTRERAERLRKTIEEMKIEAFGHRLRVSVSFGLAALDSGESAKSWLARADEALYRAKQKGRNRISIAPSGLDEEELTRLPHGASGRDTSVIVVREEPSVSDASPPSSTGPTSKKPASSAGAGAKPAPRAIAALLGSR